MGNFELSPLQFSRGGIELTQLVFHGMPQRHVSPGPESLQNQDQLDSLIKIGDRGLALIDEPFIECVAPRTNDGFVLHFMTNLVVDPKADIFKPTQSSELITAARQPGHPSVVIYTRALGETGDLLEQNAPNTHRARNIDFYLKQPLKENVKLARDCRTVANPLNRIKVLSDRVEALEEAERARKARTVFAIGSLSVSWQRRD